MPGFRSYCPSLASEGETFQLDAFESHHLLSTNRARIGDEVMVFDGKGTECTCRLDKADNRRSRLRKLTCTKLVQIRPKITLAQAMTKGKTMDSIVRQATEFGVFRIQPLISERTQVQLEHVSRKLDKWKQQCIEGCKQSGNGWLPLLQAPLRLDSFAGSLAGDLSLLASLQKKTTSWKKLDPNPATCTLIIGPEGDFSPGEYKLLEKSGAVAVSLGRHVLRSETAAISALALANQFFGYHSRSPPA